MKLKQTLIIITLILFASLAIYSQEVSNIEVSQSGKKVIINYDLKGSEEYIIELYFTTDEGKTWNGPLIQVTGAIGKKQTAGNNKQITWDVLAEKTEINSYCEFQIKAKTNDSFMNSSGTFVDERDGQEYKYVKIGTQIWMAENLAYDIGKGCWAYDNNENNVKTYRRLYNWEAAKKACPNGWHLPTDEEWEQLLQFVRNIMWDGGKSSDEGIEIGKYLKSVDSWHKNGNGTDNFGFYALPGGAYKRW